MPKASFLITVTSGTSDAAEAIRDLRRLLKALWRRGGFKVEHLEPLADGDADYARPLEAENQNQPTAKRGCPT